MNINQLRAIVTEALNDYYDADFDVTAAPFSSGVSSKIAVIVEKNDSPSSSQAFTLLLSELG